jgi:hypothetical protein
MERIINIPLLIIDDACMRKLPQIVAALLYLLRLASFFREQRKNPIPQALRP